MSSGGKYSRNILDEPDKRRISADCIVLGLGMMYEGYNVFLMRTLFINAAISQKRDYQKTVVLRDKILG